MEDSLDVPMEPPTEADPSLLASPGVPPPPPGTGSAPAAASLDGDVPMSEPNAAPIPGAVAEPVFAGPCARCRRRPPRASRCSTTLFVAQRQRPSALSVCRPLLSLERRTPRPATTVVAQTLAAAATRRRTSRCQRISSTTCASGDAMPAPSFLLRTRVVPPSACARAIAATKME